MSIEYPGRDRPLNREELEVLRHIASRPNGTAVTVSGCVPPGGSSPAHAYVDALALLIATAHVLEIGRTVAGRNFGITNKGRRALAAAK